MEYYRRLDGLRCFAITLVLIDHFGGIISKKLPLGPYGVNLFFVISGFLITSILMNMRFDSFGNAYFKFMLRRALRIFPIYYITILTLWLLQMETVKNNITWLLTYTYNYAWVYFSLPENQINHFWSLCVEEQFYLFWPLLILSFQKSPKILLSIIIFLILLGNAQSMFNIFPCLSKYNNVSLLTKLPALCIGSFTTVYINYYKMPHSFFKSKFVEIIVILILLITLLFNFTAKELVLSLCSAFLVVKTTHYDLNVNSLNDLLSNKLAVFIGSISYGIYIFHLPLSYYVTIFIINPLFFWINSLNIVYLDFLSHHDWILKLPICAITSILLAYISYKIIESPILKLKNKIRLDG